MTFKELITIIVVALFAELMILWPFVTRKQIVYKTEVQRDTLHVYPSVDDRSVLILSMMWVESNFNPDSIGENDDTGILQITPVYVREVNRILGCGRYSLDDAYDIDRSLEMFDILQSYHNPDKDIINTIHYHNKSPLYRDRVIQTYNKFKAYESVRTRVWERYR